MSASVFLINLLQFFVCLFKCDFLGFPSYRRLFSCLEAEAGFKVAFGRHFDLLGIFRSGGLDSPFCRFIWFDLLEGVGRFSLLGGDKFLGLFGDVFAGVVGFLIRVVCL